MCPTGDMPGSQTSFNQVHLAVFDWEAMSTTLATNPQGFVVLGDGRRAEFSKLLCLLIWTFCSLGTAISHKLLIE